MNNLLFFLFGLFLICAPIKDSSNIDENKVTTVYLIRHAEKEVVDKSDRNPHLTHKGIERATSISNTLANAKINAVYSTNYHRTIETARPTAELFNKEIIIYDWKSMDIDKIVSDNKGKNILIVGHSNTTPVVANKLIGKDLYKQINESDYSNLYIVTIFNNHKNSVLLKLN